MCDFLVSSGAHRLETARAGDSWRKGTSLRNLGTSTPKHGGRGPPQSFFFFHSRTKTADVSDSATSALLAVERSTTYDNLDALSTHAHTHCYRCLTRSPCGCLRVTRATWWTSAGATRISCAQQASTTRSCCGTPLGTLLCHARIARKSGRGSPVYIHIIILWLPGPYP